MSYTGMSYRNADVESPKGSKSGIFDHFFAWTSENWKVVCVYTYLFFSFLSHIILILGRSPSSKVGSHEMQGHSAFLIPLFIIWITTVFFSDSKLFMYNNEKNLVVVINFHFLLCVFLSILAEVFGS